MPGRHIVGWDIGGAHLKVACCNDAGRISHVRQIVCPLWKGVAELETATREALVDLPGASAHGLTMTGELVDIFSDRRQGVERILETLQRAIGITGSIFVYGGRKHFLSCSEALLNHTSVASANWYASEQIASGFVKQGLFLDIGSTTTDIAVFRDGQVAVRGHTDATRMQYDELVYAGTVRTPLIAICGRVPFNGAWVPLTAEYFAVTADLFRLTGELPVNADMHATADGADKSLESSARRIARMIGLDSLQFKLDVWRKVARYLESELVQKIQTACELQLSRGIIDDEAPVIGAGVGRFIARKIAARIGRDYLDFAELLSVDEKYAAVAADCAPAVSVALLLARHMNLPADPAVQN